VKNKIPSNDEFQPDFVRKANFIYVWMTIVIVILLFVCFTYNVIQRFYPNIPYANEFYILNCIVCILIFVGWIADAGLVKYCQYRYQKLGETQSRHQRTRRGDTGSGKIGEHEDQKTIEDFSLLGYKMRSWEYYKVKAHTITENAKHIFEAKKPRPDFTKEPVELINVRKKTIDVDSWDNVIMAVFTNYDPPTAVRNKWFVDIEGCVMLATLEFGRRFPKHEFAKIGQRLQKALKLTGEDIIRMSNGQKKFWITHKDGQAQFTSEK